MNTEKDTTHFGFTEVPWHEKAERVRGVFSSVAHKYDLMNDVMSFGLHRIWKKFTIDIARVRAGYAILDIAGGTGDLAKAFVKQVGQTGRVVLADINDHMLKMGRQRLTDAGVIKQIDYVQADAEALPFQNDYFDLITISFGLRNVTNKLAALQSMQRVLKPGGRLLILEFSKPIISPLAKIYDAYSMHIIPKLGALIADDAASYQYLVESIRMHPNQTQLQTLMEEAGFEDITFHNLSGGIVALHQGFKY